MTLGGRSAHPASGSRQFPNRPGQCKRTQQCCVTYTGQQPEHSSLLRPPATAQPKVRCFHFLENATTKVTNFSVHHSQNGPCPISGTGQANVLDSTLRTSPSPPSRENMAAKVVSPFRDRWLDSNPESPALLRCPAAAASDRLPVMVGSEAGSANPSPYAPTRRIPAS